MLSAVFIVVFLITTVHASLLYAMDLMEAYKLAKEHDAEFGSAFYEHEAAKTLSRQGLSFLLPQMQATGSLSKYDFLEGPSTYADYDSRSLNVNVRQPIFDIRRYYEYRQHNLKKTMGDAKFMAGRQDLMLRVIEAYFSGLAAKDAVDLVDSEKKAVSEQRDQARRMFQSGIATLADVHEAEARYDDVQSQEIEAKNTFDIKIQALKRIIGGEPGQLNGLKEGVPFRNPDPEHIDDWVEKARKHNPTLKYYAEQVEVQQREVKKTSGQHFPTLDLVAGYTNTNTDSLIKTKTIGYCSVGVQLNLPIFSGGYISAKVAENRALLQKSKKDYESSLAELTQKLTESFLAIQGSIAKIDALATAVKSADTALHSNKMGLTAGVRTTTDVLNAQRERHNVRAKLFRARYDYLVYLVRLKFYAGILGEDDLLMINQWMQ